VATPTNTATPTAISSPVPGSPTPTATATLTPSPIPTNTVTGTVSTWYFAEGSTQANFSTFLLLENPGTANVTSTVTYYKESGPPFVKQYGVRAASRANIFVNAEVSNAALSMKVESNGVIYAERAMYTGLDGHASHGIAQPSRTWYFAEGATTSSFQTWVLLFNPNSTSAQATVSLLREGGGTPIVRTYTLAPASRTNVYVNNIVPNAAVATSVSSDIPIVAERSMYFGSGSHGSSGVTQPAINWYLAEGFTGGGFDTWILVANPGSMATQATVNFMLEGGGTVSRVYNIAPFSRLNVWANQIVPNIAFATQVMATHPVVVERAMYFGPSNARGGHNSEAATAPALVWNLAEGSTQSTFNTFILVLNPGDAPANVSLRFLQQAALASTQTFSVLGHSRFTVWANQLISNVAFSTVVTSDQPVVVERAMYFNNNSGGTAALGIPGSP
jgi:hypothetical protein